MKVLTTAVLAANLYCAESVPRVNPVTIDYPTKKVTVMDFPLALVLAQVLTDLANGSQHYCLVADVDEPEKFQVLRQ